MLLQDLTIAIVTSLSDSKRIWSYSDRATRKIIEVTFSKQWIHFRLSDLWPPTSTILQEVTVNIGLYLTYVNIFQDNPTNTWKGSLVSSLDTWEGSALWFVRDNATFNYHSHYVNNDLKTMLSRSKGYSIMPVVGTLDLRMSCSVGR